MQPKEILNWILDTRRKGLTRVYNDSMDNFQAWLDPPAVGHPICVRCYQRDCMRELLCFEAPAYGWLDATESVYRGFDIRRNQRSWMWELLGFEIPTNGWLDDPGWDLRRIWYTNEKARPGQLHSWKPTVYRSSNAPSLRPGLFVFHSPFISPTSTFDSIQMASSILFVFLGLLRLTLSLPVDPTQTVGRLTGNSFGLPGQNVTYDYIVGAISPLTPTEQLD